LTRKVPTKNYIIVIGLVVLAICACLAFNNLYNIYLENRISTSPLANKEILYEDLKNATTDIEADTFLLISYVENKDIYENEKEIKKYLNKQNLLDNVLYLNVTDYLTNENLIDEINNTLGLEDNLKISSLPALIYYRDGTVTYTIDSKDGLINKGDFQHIIDMYELAS
jgi:hypothetical protein